MMKKKISLSVFSVLTSSFMSMGLQASSTEPPSSQLENSPSELTSQSALHTPSYLGLNPDVNDQAKQDQHDPHQYAKLHFNLYGKNEKRAHLTEEEHSKLPEGFDAQTYIERHPDVGEYASSQKVDQQSFAKYHYLKYGKNENRGFERAPQETSSSSVSIPPAPATQSSSKNIEQEGADVSSAPKVVEGDQKVPTLSKAPENVDRSDAVSLSPPSKIEEPLPKPSAEESQNSSGATGVPAAPLDSVSEGGEAPQEDVLGRLAKPSSTPLTHPNKDRANIQKGTTNKRLPTRKPRVKAQDIFNQAPSAGGASLEEENAAGQQVPSASATEDNNPSTGAESSVKSSVEVAPPATEPSEPDVSSKKVRTGPGPTVTLGDLKIFKKKTPEDRKSFVREKMGSFSNLDVKTKRDVEGDIAALLRDSLEPGSQEYQEFKGYQTQLKTPNMDLTQSLPASGLASLKKTQSGVKPSAQQSDDSKEGRSTPFPIKLRPTLPAPKSEALASSSDNLLPSGPKGPPTALQKLSALARNLSANKASPTFLSKNSGSIMQDIETLRKENAADPKAMALADQVEKALRAAQDSTNEEGSVKRSSVLTKTGEDEQPPMVPVSFSSTATPVTRVFGDPDERTPTQS